ncbi:methyltransferase domain-containing protein [Algoriphagus sp. H41]|uniref:Methyltransferase domain-containing protein n=1 Tax=Algoriphagus oliviformis TaxID=2811231 RepID=A0ABS3C7F2_9BACT|nr:methyltransferase domain-containing protein [Algoriphagus oliviformis]MBN7812943.1 methyltransferase domain-containing protein [Algoriphagus oliviformis]
MNLRRRIYSKILEYSYKMQSLYDKDFISICHSDPSINHLNWKFFILDNFDRPGLKVLEVGSREVTGKSFFKDRFKQANYVGFDFYPGVNVDVVGDVHKLVSYFENEKFDLIFSSACFEHFAMPWVASKQIIQLLNVGGRVFVETHFSFGLHELPWNFFQFSHFGLEVLFPPVFGIKKIDSGVSNPIVGRFSKFASPYLRYKKVKNLFCHSYFFGEKVEDVKELNYSDIDLSKLLTDSVYPVPK